MSPFLAPLAALLAAVALGPATARGDGAAGDVEWLATVRQDARPPSRRLGLERTGYVASTGVRFALADADARVRLSAAETSFGGGVLTRQSAGVTADVLAVDDGGRSFALAIDWKQHSHPADQAEWDSTSLTVTGLVTQRLRGPLAPVLAAHAEVSRETGRADGRPFPGITAAASAELSVAPSSDWELSLGLTGESSRFDAASRGAPPGSAERYGGLALAAEHTLSPTTHVRCEAEAGVARSLDAAFDGPRRQAGCYLRWDL